MTALTEVKKKSLDQWQSYIGTSLKKTAQATLDTATRISEYKLAASEDEFNKTMKQWFGFSPSHLSYWSKIAECMARFETHLDVLPASSRTLYELSSIDDDLWDELVETGDVTPSLTVEGAKGLKINGGYKKSTAKKYGEADNFLEIMQKLDEVMDMSVSVKDAKKLMGKWLKDHPPTYEEDEEELPPLTEEGDEIIEPLPVPDKGTSSAVRVKCLALFGIYVDKPIVDKDILTCLDRMAGSDETKLAAIATLEDE